MMKSISDDREEEGDYSGVSFRPQGEISINITFGQNLTGKR
jgi:hypothetical protein